MSVLKRKVGILRLMNESFPMISNFRDPPGVSDMNLKDDIKVALKSKFIQQLRKSLTHKCQIFSKSL